MFRSGYMFERKKEMDSRPTLGRMKPFKLFGNTYFVGTYQASCHLIDTGDGLIMIDPGYAKTAFLVVNSIHELGFKPEDIKYIINTHWHGDHTEATADFADLTGAKTLLGRDDLERASKYFTPDILVDDGDTLTLGNVTVRFMHTPGHTKGTISFFYDYDDGERVYRFGSFGGAGANTLVPGAYDFEGCREAYYDSLDRLMKEEVDVFVGNHTWNNATWEKSLELFEGNERVFVDPTLWGRFLGACRDRLNRVIEREKAEN